MTAAWQYRHVLEKPLTNRKSIFTRFYETLSLTPFVFNMFYILTKLMDVRFVCEVKIWTSFKQNRSVILSAGYPLLSLDHLHSVFSVMHLNDMLSNWNQEGKSPQGRTCCCCVCVCVCVCCQSTPLYPLNTHSKQEAVVWHYKLLCMFKSDCFQCGFFVCFNDIIFRW